MEHKIQITITLSSGRAPVFRNLRVEGRGVQALARGWLQFPGRAGGVPGRGALYGFCPTRARSVFCGMLGLGANGASEVFRPRRLDRI